jgi:hypothetical protein
MSRKRPGDTFPAAMSSLGGVGVARKIYRSIGAYFGGETK